METDARKTFFHLLYTGLHVWWNNVHYTPIDIYEWIKHCSCPSYGLFSQLLIPLSSNPNMRRKLLKCICCAAVCAASIFHFIDRDILKLSNWWLHWFSIRFSISFETSINITKHHVWVHPFSPFSLATLTSLHSDNQIPIIWRNKVDFKDGKSLIETPIVSISWLSRSHVRSKECFAF